MKRLLIIALLALPTSAHANLKCGLKPLPPLGCYGKPAMCYCDANGNCQWVYICN